MDKEAIDELIAACVEYRAAGIAVQTDASFEAGARFHVAYEAFEAALRKIGAIQ